MKRKEKTGKKPGKERKAESAIARTDDRDCPFHGNLKARGRIFEGKVIKKFSNRVAIEFERMVYVKKYERYSRSKTKIHARLPSCMEKDIDIGDLISIQECRPLSKIIHFVVIKKIKGRESFFGGPSQEKIKMEEEKMEKEK
ncbi:MAG: 30S ribosomal protein S17 [Nanoarchaeota archaeon]